MLGVIPCACGHCLPCKINRRRLWSHRIMLETFMHEASSFLTLTYAPEFLPQDLSLKVRDYQLFMKRLRKKLKKKFDSSVRVNMGNLVAPTFILLSSVLILTRLVVKMVLAELFARLGVKDL